MDQARRQAEAIERQAGEIARRAPPPALAAVARGRRDGARLEKRKPAPADAAHEIDVFHERKWVEAAEPLIERLGDEEALIAVGKCKHARAPGDQPLEPACRPAVVVEREAEDGGALAVPRLGDEAADGRRPAGLEARVGMEEEEPLSARSRGPRRELAAARGCGREHARAV